LIVEKLNEFYFLTLFSLLIKVALNSKPNYRYINIFAFKFGGLNAHVFCQLISQFTIEYI